VTGEGFLWRQTIRRSTISNNVRTVIETPPGKIAFHENYLASITLLALTGDDLAGADEQRAASGHAD